MRNLIGAAAVSTGNKTGRYNKVDMFHVAGTFDWVKPENLDPDTPITVRVWGAGGAGGCYSSVGNSFGGGAGGLSIKEISFEDLLATTVMALGLGAKTHNGRGGTTSFGTHNSATGGNSGFYNTQNESGGTRPISDIGGSANYYGQGGIGIGGDTNRRGGWGGFGSTSPTSGYGGGGASAPHPDGHLDGFHGGRTSSYGGGGGASIAYNGGQNTISYDGQGGAGTAGPASIGGQQNTYGTSVGGGGTGILGAGGKGGAISNYSNAMVSIDTAESGQGTLILEPNYILFGGGGGGGGCMNSQSSETGRATAGNGGPGAGGGGAGGKASSTAGGLNHAGNGGMLGGGGGANQYSYPGHGGNAAGGGGTGYDKGPEYGNGWGGDGLIIIQYNLIY
ncbi:MAG: hypothetical protein COA63_014085 [Methylophaga sp.]|nr:hypothetical protein [Methylophaga sp.]